MKSAPNPAAFPKRIKSRTVLNNAAADLMKTIAVMTGPRAGKADRAADDAVSEPLIKSRKESPLPGKQA